MSDLLTAVDKATALVSSAGGGVVSMSWGSSEFAGEMSYDSHFSQANNVTYIASAGDAPGVLWPSSSAYVISAGGTSISRNPTNGNFESELTWQQTGSGISQYVPQPPYQSSLGLSSYQSAPNSLYRAVPDVAAVADPDTGVWVYAQYACTYIYNCGGSYWLPVGGTSVAAPVEAGVMSFNMGYKSLTPNASQSTLLAIYGVGGPSIGSFLDIAAGNCGQYAGYIAGAGWDLCSGQGTLLGPN